MQQKKTCRQGQTARPSTTNLRSRAIVQAVEQLENRQLFAVNSSVIDLFMGYTAADVQEVGSVQLMQEKINRGVQLLNQTLANSKVAAVYRLVGTLQSNYTESGDGKVDLDRLKNSADPQMADLKTAATAAGADVVDMIVTKMTGLGGITSQNYNMILLSFLDNGVLSHEIGHTMGGGHGHDQDGQNNANGAYETDLKFGDQTYSGAISGNLNYYSNPNVFFRGVPTGVAGTGPTAANNAAVMNKNAPALSNISATKVVDSTGPNAQLGSIWSPNTGTAAGAVTFQVIYTDGSGVNVDTLGSNDVVVSGPNGFSAAANLVSVDDTTTNYGYHVATYSVSTPGAVGDLSQYAFNLQANAVNDTVGNASPAGVLGGPSQFSPDYAGSDGSHSAEIGDLAGQTWQVTDEVGPKYQGNYFDPANYHFTLSKDTTLTVTAPARTTAGVPLTVTIWNDANGNLLEENGEGVNPTSPGKYDLKAGQNYYFELSAWQSGTIPYGFYTVNIASSNAATAPAAPSTLSGLVFSDANNNGTQEDGEPPIAAVGLQLTGTDTLGRPVTLTALTDATGKYTFSNVPPSSAAGYTLTELPVFQSNVQTAQGKTTVGNLSGTANGNVVTGIAVTPGSTGTGYIFSNLPVAPLALTTISGRVYIDPTGEQNPNGPETKPVTGAQLTLTGRDIRGNDVNLTATTDATGNYTFTNVPPSDPNQTWAGYSLTLIQPTTSQLAGRVIGTLSASGFSNTGFVGIKVDGVAGTGYDFPQNELTSTQPTATDQTVNGQQNGTITGDVNAAPTAPVASAARASALIAPTAIPTTTVILVPGTGPLHAKSFVLNEDGTYTYVPQKNFFGTDSFTYLRVSSNGTSATAKVTINVAHVNQAPEFSTEIVSTVLTSAKDPVTIDLRTRVTDVDSTKIKFKITKIRGGFARILKDGHTLLFTPYASFYGAAKVDFIATDGIASTQLSQGICVCRVDIGPSTKNDFVTTQAGQSVTIDPLANDKNKVAGVMQLVSVTAPKHGTVKIDKMGSTDPTKWRVVYKPTAGFHGTDAFMYQVTDLWGRVSKGKITVTVL